MDAEDESLARWKASLGITGESQSSGDPSKPKLSLHSLALISQTAPGGKVQLDLNNLTQAQLDEVKKSPLTIKEGVEYNVAISFSVGQEVLSGLKYIHVVKRAGITVDKLEQMIGSYGPRQEPYTATFATEESPSGVLARSGSNTVRSRVIDDDNNVYADFTWVFKIAKDW